MDQEILAEQSEFICIEEAAKELSVKRPTVYYYLNQLGIQTHRFALDRKTYIRIEDLKSIKVAKKAATGGRR